jgi:8-oxo-dGTP pyrophosphatase MutT (NUDIX family)
VTGSRHAGHRAGADPAPDPAHQGPEGERDPAGPAVADADEQWQVLDSDLRARSHVVALRTDLVLMPDGTSAERDVVVHPGAVGIVALDDDDQVLMIRQYRHPVGRMLWEIPAGLRDVEGEPIAVTAERELLEETGHRARDWRVLVDYFSSPGMTNERLRVYLARGLSEIDHAEREFVPRNEEAHLLLAWVPLDRAVELFLAGDLHNGVAAVGILSAYAARRDGFAGLRPVDAPER